MKPQLGVGKGLCVLDTSWGRIILHTDVAVSPRDRLCLQTQSHGLNSEPSWGTAESLQMDTAVTAGGRGRKVSL